MALSGRPKKVDPQVDLLPHQINQRDFENVKKTLTEFGINVRDGDGRTALVNSVIENQLEFIIWLVDNGADIDVQDRAGYSALHFVAQNASIEIGKYLVSKNPNVDLHDRYGNTPLWTAVANVRQGLGAVKLLVDHGANLDNVNKFDRTPRQVLQEIYGDSFGEVIGGAVV